MGYPTARSDILSCSLVPEDEAPSAMLARKIGIYADEPDVKGKIVTKKVEVLPGRVETVSFVVLWREP